MCVVLIALQAHPKYPLIIAANRDEYWERATQPLDWWTDADILAGRDLVAGGTWLGINRRGQIGLVTNVREGIRPDSKNKSRGDLVRDYLLRGSVPTDFAAYAPFNLVAGNSRGMKFYSNRYPARSLDKGIWGISNGPLEPPWPKTRMGMKKLEEICRLPEVTADLFWPLLGDRSMAKESELPDTGVGKALEIGLSSLYVHLPDRKYGTRSSSVLLLNSEGHAEVTERTYSPDGKFTQLSKAFTV